MEFTLTARTLLRTAKQIAHEEFDAPSTEAILAVFYRLCIEHDRALERELDHGDNDQHDWRH